MNEQEHRDIDAGPPAERPTSGWVGTTGPAGDGVVPPDPPRRRSTRESVVRTLLVVAMVVLGALGYTILRGAQVDDYDRIANDVGERLAALPEFKARFGEVDSGDEAFDFGQELGAAAIARLGDADLETYWRTTSAMLAAAEPVLCGKVFRQTASRSELEDIGRKLTLDEWRTLLDITVRAVELELAQGAAPPAPSQEEVDDAFVVLAGAMGAERAIETGTTLNDASASDAEVCTAGRALIDGVLALPDGPRGVLLRSLANSG